MHLSEFMNMYRSQIQSNRCNHANCLTTEKCNYIFIYIKELATEGALYQLTRTRGRFLNSTFFLTILFMQYLKQTTNLDCLQLLATVYNRFSYSEGVQTQVLQKSSMRQYLRNVFFLLSKSATVLSGFREQIIN